MKHYQRIALFLVLVLFLVGTVAGCDRGTKEASVLKLAHEDPPDNQWGMGANHFAKLVEEKSKGALKVEVYDSGQLGSGADNLQHLQTDALDMTIVGSDMAQIDSYFELFDLPYLFRDRDHAKKVLTTDSLMEEANEALEGHKLRVVGFWENGFRQITNKKQPIVKPEDLKGLKIRVPNNPVRVDTFKAYGSNPIGMSYSELYSALQTGVVEAQENPLGNIWGDKLYEVQKYISMSNHVFTPIFVLVSEGTWNKLDKAHQAILVEAARETTIWQMDWAAEREGEWLEDVLAFGCEVTDHVDTDAFIAASTPIWDAVIQENGEAVAKTVDEIKNTK